MHLRGYVFQYVYVCVSGVHILLHDQYTAICMIKAMGPRQNGPNFAEDIFKCFLLNENAWMSNKISLKFVGRCPINNIPALVQIMV